MNHSIIVVDDDRDFLEIVRLQLSETNFSSVRIEDDPHVALNLFENKVAFDVALIDMNMPEMDGLSLLQRIKKISPETECIMVTAVNEARVAVTCLNRGAYDYLVKPASREDLVLAIGRAMEKKRLVDLIDIQQTRSLEPLKDKSPFKPIITRSTRMLRRLKEAELHARSDVPVQITGESGTGKELLARAIHRASSRRREPFTPINMAALTDSLFDAEFFGHTRGAFTGAEKERIGLLEYTEGGTLFLDEIGTMPMALQGKLLRVLQDGQYTKLGTSRTQKADVRIVAATNEDLGRQMAKNLFRKDLYYRIRGGWIHLPPLRQRREDIPLLVAHFLWECKGGHPEGIDEGAMSLLMEYRFPGNIRELRSIIQSATNLAQGKRITAAFFLDHLKQHAITRASKPPEGQPTILTLAQVEKAHILKAYNLTGGNKAQTARALGIGLNTLRRKLESYGIHGLEF